MFGKSRNKIVKRSLESQKVETEKTRVSRMIFYFLIFIFGTVLVYVFFFSPFLQIKKIMIRGLEELDYDRVLGVVSGDLGQKYFGFLAKDNLLLFSSGALEADLKDNFKKISAVEVKKVFPETLVISIRERKALLVWCGSADCFLVDEGGFAYTSADFSSSEITENNLIVVRDLGQESAMPDRAVINPDVVDFILAIRQEAKTRLDLDLNPEFETPKSISGDIVATTSEGWKIRFNKDLGAIKEIVMLQLVLDQNIGKEKRSDLDYVDLRTDGKVYFKLKSAPSEEETAKVEDKKAGN